MKKISRYQRGNRRRLAALDRRLKQKIKNGTDIPYDHLSCLTFHVLMRLGDELNQVHRDLAALETQIKRLR